MITEWTPEAWATYCTENPARRLKAERDRQLVAEMLGALTNLSILEAGCGYGRLTPLLKGASQLLVMDRAWRMVQSVREGVNANLWGVVADLHRLPIQPAVFDKVLCIGVLMHVENPWKVLEGLAKIIRPGGTLMISFNNGWSPWAPLMALWAHRPGALRQRFLSLGLISRHLRRMGFTIHCVRGDAVIPMTTAIPGTQRSLWPSWALRGTLRLEQWPLGRWLLSTLGYELFVIAQTEGK